jgi:hypothetical protein
MLKMCSFCNTEYRAKTHRSNYCSKSCKDKYWYILNKEYKKQYYVDNFESIQARERLYTVTGVRRDRNEKWYSKNGLEYYTNRRRNIEYRLTKNLRTRLWKALKDNWKSGSTISDLGCSIAEFKEHLESKFKHGMTWNNYGRWELDHIIPLSAVDLTDRDEFIKVVHYTNIQPLWRPENIAKSNKVVG